MTAVTLVCCPNGEEQRLEIYYLQDDIRSIKTSPKLRPNSEYRYGSRREGP